MSSIRRVYVTKKKGYNVEGQHLLMDLKHHLGLENLKNVVVLNRYDIDHVSQDIYKEALHTIFSEPPVDSVYEEEYTLESDETVFAVEYLPGQYDQRADSCEQAIRILAPEENPVVRAAKGYVLKGDLTETEIEAVKHYVINPVDSREAIIEKPDTLELEFEIPHEVDTIEFINLSDEEVEKLWRELSLAMTVKDLLHTRDYFKTEEKRNPTITEIRVLDTYWSDHCRHTTFLTKLNTVDFEDGKYVKPIEDTYKQYLQDRQVVLGDKAEHKHVCLMDIALLAMKKMRKEGKLDDLEVSDEINACSIVVDVDIDGEDEEWLVMFKNETHNHPTEIEPFGGAATCLGGAIRDPLSGRSYVYQAMRVTGAADPTVDVSETIEGKLPQRKIVTESAQGYSSYGNQIGLATGQVDEIYHPNYVAKRLEIGAVIAAAPRENVIRETSDPDDIIVLLGGRTGRDGCGGATGSSKSHTDESIHTCGAEVQKGNPPTERKIQRLFRNPKVSKLIKKCNDFGAGGVSVAIGELADGLIVDLNKVPKKYAGLDGTELSISESQERMAVVLDPKDVERFIQLSEDENLEAVAVAVVTEEKRLVMRWNDQNIVNVSREFLDTNGATSEADVKVVAPEEKSYFEVRSEEGKKIKDVKIHWESMIADLNVCSKKGLIERFDSSIGASSVLMPFGGKYQLTPTESMVAKIPLEEGDTNTGTIMSYGYNPYLAAWSPYHGAVYAVIDSLAKVVAAGGDYNKTRFTFQEYFKRINGVDERWSEPMSSLLGAYYVQDQLGLASIGGKDSMSGSFNDIDVPPTLVSFAVNPTKVDKVISPELKEVGSVLIDIPLNRDDLELPKFEQLKGNYDEIYRLIQRGKVLAAHTVPYGGIAEALTKMSFGNKIGVKIHEHIDEEHLFLPHYGSIILEMTKDNVRSVETGYYIIGETIEAQEIQYKDTVLPIDTLIEKWADTLENVYETKTKPVESELIDTLYNSKELYIAKNKIAKPKVLIPVFPGTNCEYDTKKAFELAGAEAETLVFKNLNGSQINDSIEAMTKAIKDSQIVMVPGGFSAGDEPEGSGKFIATIFRNPHIAEAVNELLKNRDGLMLGICNGFQALIKLGLVPYGEITNLTDEAPTLTYNTIGRHISCMVDTKIMTNKSPWLANVNVGDIHSIPVSHGEGRFVASKEMAEKLFANGQVVTTYVDGAGKPSMDIPYNPNGSLYAIEGITSPDGRVLGKMGHSERIGNNVAKNIIGVKDQMLFKSGVEYFK